jgi:5-methylcytosine-specific restriction endonuclease McrA
MVNLRRKQCGKPECKRAFNAARMRDWQRKYQVTHGRWYPAARHGEAQRAYNKQRRQELGSWRKRYPAAAVAGDARRRMRMEQARTAEVFAPLDVHTRDGWTCQLCQLPIDPEVAWPDPMSPSVDHIVPLSRGGLHSMANVQSAHLGCNSSKCDKIIDRSESIKTS